MLVVQLCLTLCGPMDCNRPGSCVHRIFQARMLEWVAMPSPRGFSRYRDRTCVSCISCTAGRFSTTELLGKPTTMRTVKYFLCVGGLNILLLNFRIIFHRKFSYSHFVDMDWKLKAVGCSRPHNYLQKRQDSIHLCLTESPCPFS